STQYVVAVWPRLAPAFPPGASMLGMSLRKSVTWAHIASAAMPFLLPLIPGVSPVRLLMKEDGLTAGVSPETPESPPYEGLLVESADAVSPMPSSTVVWHW